ncbi:MAG TPA: M12 family metallo-peptidase [Opitutaceae bacterium]|nr:M12 family metallo-peptidase [Opitutaceae bacterium]
MKKAILIVAVLLGVAVLWDWRPGVRPGTDARAGAERQHHTAAAPPTPTPAEAPVPAAPAPPAAPQPQPSAALLAALQEILPGISAVPADWRSFAPERLTVRPIAGVAIEFIATHVAADGTRTIWTGINGTPGVTLASSGTRDRWDAVVTIPGALEYDLHVTPTGVAVEKKDFAAEMCKSTGTVAGDAEALMAPQAQPPPIEAAPTTYTADLLVLYTTAAGNALGGAAAVQNNVSARIASSNVYLSQSQVDNVVWRVVGVVEATGYTETGNLTTDLNNLASRATTLGAFAAQQRNQYGADQVTLIVNSSSDGFAGIAFTPGAYSVTIRAGSAGVIAHELAHNFGCHHDRQQDNAPDNDGQYHYGYRYLDGSGRDTGTIMSYAAFRVPYYSNPNLTYQGHILGLPAGDPRAADNARVLRENAQSIASLRPTVVGEAPAITSQPASVTVTAGQPFSLSVTASGDGLSYQWAHDGMNVPAGTGSSYSVGSSASADAGSYTVTVSNSSGSVQSNPVTVTVNPASPSPVPPPSGSASGGGGGAFDVVTALAAVSLLAEARRARSRHTVRTSARRQPALAR